MSTGLSSPGVSTREIDASQLTQQPVTVGAAIIGPTVKGPVEVPTVVTSYSEYVNTFGDAFVFGSQYGDVNVTYLTSVSAENYFNSGGESLLVTRVASGSFTEATSTPILNTAVIGTSIEVGFDTDLTSSITTFPTGVQLNRSFDVTPTTSGDGSGLELQYYPHFDRTVGPPYRGYQINVTKPGTGYLAGDTITIPGTQLGLNPDGRLITGENNLSQSITEAPVDGIRNLNTAGGSSLRGWAFADGAFGTGQVNYVITSTGTYTATVSNLEMRPPSRGRTTHDNNFNIGEKYAVAFYAGRSWRYITWTLTADNFEAHTPLVITLRDTDIAVQTGDIAFELATLSKGELMNSNSTSTDTLEKGTKDNVRWEISEVNTTSGEFTLLIRRGDDKASDKVVLETFTNLSLDPKSPNYISKRIGDQVQTIATEGTDTYLETVGQYPNKSKYVRVKSVAYKTPNYLNNDGTPNATFQTYIPVVQSGSFAGANGAESPNGNATFYKDIVEDDVYTSQGVPAASYASAIALLANKDEYRYNVISVPGLTYDNSNHTSTLNTLIENTENRGDAIAVVDIVNYGSTVANVKAKAAALDSSYAATYWPWLTVQDPSTGLKIEVPPSTLIPGVYTYTDKVAAPWFAPAGTKRGLLGNAAVGERKLAQTTRDELYTSKVNPITSVSRLGTVVYGQKTLQTRASALDRVNVRRLLIELKSYLGQVAGTLVFEQNSISTRNSFISRVTPYLEGIQQNQGLYTFKVVMDDSNNTPDVVDRNELIGQIYIQPAKTAEFIYLDFNITPTGVAFPD